MAGKFEVYKDGKGKYRFRLKAGNGQIIAMGEAYESMPACMNGIDSVRNHATTASVVDMTAQGMSAKPTPKPAAKRKATMAR